MAHSRLSASAAHRWLACPGSVDGPAGEPSNAAEEGTAAHALAHTCLDTHTDAWEHLGTVVNDKWTVTEEMATAVQVYLDHVRSLDGADRYFELALDGSMLHADLGGTADCVVDNGRVLHVVDYKHGAGVRVDAVENDQLKIYALLFLLAKGRPARTVKLTIVQPRAGGPEIATFTTPSEELYRWETETLLPAIRAAGRKEYIAGDHCRFCPRRLSCPALKQLRQETMNMEPEAVEFLSDEELASSWQSVKVLKAWISAVEGETLRRLTAGQRVPGLKLVEGRSLRQFKAGAETAAKAAFGEQAYTVPELKSPAQIEKLPGGKAFTSAWAYSPPGKLTVAEASDPRPETSVVSLADELLKVN